MVVKKKEKQNFKVCLLLCFIFSTTTYYKLRKPIIKKYSFYVISFIMIIIKAF